MSNIRNKTIRGLKAGDSFRVTRTFSEEDVLKFADISRDYNPVHFDERFAGTKQFDGRICHGLLVGSLVTEIGGQIGWLASGMQFRFMRPVYFGETISCTFTITEVDARGRAIANIRYTNAKGRVVMEAELTGIIPGREERQVMKQMIAEGDPTNKIGERA